MHDLGIYLGGSYYDALHYALAIAEEGQALEFGVATGTTLKMIAGRMPVTGFDSFDGLPEDWREGFPKGMFAQEPPKVEGAKIVEGLFEDTLPKWLNRNTSKRENITLVHIDCDLYSSTKTVLDNLNPYLKKGTLVVFDEYHGYPGWEEGEYKAWQEFADKHKVKWEPIGYGPEQFVLRITG